MFYYSYHGNQQVYLMVIKVKRQISSIGCNSLWLLIYQVKPARIHKRCNHLFLIFKSQSWYFHVETFL